MRISLRDRDHEQELPLGSLHRLLVADPAFGLVILRALRDGEQGRVCSEVWVAPKHYKAREWARMGQVGYPGVEHDGVWAGMVGQLGEPNPNLCHEVVEPCQPC